MKLWRLDNSERFWVTAADAEGAIKVLSEWDEIDPSDEPEVTELDHTSEAVRSLQFRDDDKPSDYTFGDLFDDEPGLFEKPSYVGGTVW